MLIVKPVAFILGLAVNALSAILVLSVIISWLDYWQRTSRSAPRMYLGHPVIRWIEDVSNTMLRPIRRAIDPYQRSTGMDFSPLIALLVLGLIGGWVSNLPF